MNQHHFRKKLYTLCAAAGILSAVLAPCSGENGIFPAAEEIGKSKSVLSADSFTDVPSDSWYYTYVDALVKSKIVVGTSADTFSPSDRFTVAEAATVISRYLGLDSYAATRKSSADAAIRSYWYGGYLQTLVDAGIMKNGEYGLTVSQSGLITSLSPEVCSRPILRYEFASLISRSFEIKTDIVKARHIPSELSPSGNSFITGGKYDDTVSRYAAEITDFDSIPAEYQTDVLKAYYNGIFNGDENGYFHPNDPLLRSEMAKAASVISDSSLRKRTEYRGLFALYGEISANRITDGRNKKVLDRSFAYKVLLTNADTLAISSSGVYNSIAYTPLVAPEGYMTEVWVYEKDDGGQYRQIARRLSYETELLTADGENIRILFILRNRDDAAVEGVVQTDIAKNGTVTQSTRFKSVL